MKRTAILFSIIAVTALICSCESAADQIDDDGFTADVSVDSSDYTDSVATAESATYVAEDVEGTYAFTDAGTIDLAAIAAGTLAAGVEITASGNAYAVTSTLAEPVSVTLTGTMSGSIDVTGAGVVRVVLSGASITAPTGAPLSFSSSSRAFVTMAAGTSNALTDTASGKKGALYCAGPLIIGGEGSLTVNANYKHGIYSADYIRFSGGSVAVNVTARDAVRSVNGIIVDDVGLTIKATGTTADDESKGMKVDGDDDSSYGAGKGYIVINGGSIDITSVSKAISAGWDIDEDLGDNGDGNPDPDVTINSGYITITTTGTPYETSTASLSPEGIEGKSDLTVNGGYIVIDSSDDCLNAGDSIVVNGGYVYCVSSSNDAIDSNGTLTIAGGVIVAAGSSAPESGFDCDQNTFAITGGTFIATGGSTSTPTAGACTQNALVINNIAALAGSTIGVRDSSGQTVFVASVADIAGSVVLSSPTLLSDTEYTVYAGGAGSADEEFYGLGLESLYHSGGTSAATATTSSTVTVIGTTTGANGR